MIGITIDRQLCFLSFSVSPLIQNCYFTKHFKIVENIIHILLILGILTQLNNV